MSDRLAHVSTSSSTIRIRGMWETTLRLLRGPGRCAARQANREGRANAQLAFDVQRPVVTVDYFIGNGKSQSHPLGFRRIKWLENPPHIFLGDTDPRVLDGNGN